ncbi:condensation domain-containing protein, partial [Xenorhabdus sp. SGI246]|uniref:condensation domain-containing protein n=1 Tax=Xenorhabdus sp. SGI246 TaxID=3158263 RepID=UPI00349F342D
LYLNDKLPTYMIPTLYVSLAMLPRLPNGKINHQNLPEPSWDSKDSGYIAPRTETEKTLAKLWSDVLSQLANKKLDISATDNFFELGGHSLIATQLFARIRNEFGINLPVSMLFNNPILEQFSELIEKAILVDQQKKINEIPVVNRQNVIPLSYEQERLWFIHNHVEEQRTSYNIPITFHIYGEKFSLNALKKAFNILVERHEILRTTFYQLGKNGSPKQLIHTSLILDIDIECVEYKDIQMKIFEHANHVFNLEKGPLLNINVLEISKDDHIIMINIHHIICDGWSLDILFRELHELYSSIMDGKLLELPPLKIQYADYSIWQRKKNLDKHLEYWTNTLDKYEDGILLPYDFPRPANRLWHVKTYKYTYPKILAHSVNELSKQFNVTIFITLLTSFSIVIKKFTGREDLCIGTTISDRNPVELEQLIGFFVNILALRLDLCDDPTVETLLLRVKKQVLDAFEHSDLPFEHVLAALQKQRDSSQIPLVPIMLRHQNFPATWLDNWHEKMDIQAVEYDYTRTTPNEIDLRFTGDGSSLEVEIEYPMELFNEKTIKHLINVHQEVLENMIKNSDQNLSQFIFKGHTPICSNLTLDTSKDLITIFSEQVIAKPQMLACIGEENVSYQELDLRSNQLARYLIAQGVSKN